MQYEPMCFMLETLYTHWPAQAHVAVHHVPVCLPSQQSKHKEQEKQSQPPTRELKGRR